MNFDDVLVHVNGIAEEDKAALLALAQKYPDLDKAVAPRPALAALETKYTQANGLLSEWEGWKKNYWDSEHKMTKAQWDAEQKLAQTQARVAMMEAGGYTGGEEVDFAKVDEYLKSNGYVKADAIKDLAKQADVEAKLNMHGANMEHIFVNTANLPLRYQQEFGKAEFDMNGFIRFALADPTGGRVNDMNKAFDEFVAPKRLEVERHKLDEDRKALDTQRQELETRKAAGPNPSDTSQAATVIPPFQREVQGLAPADEKKLAEGAPLGSGVLGAQLWEQYKSGSLKTQ